MPMISRASSMIPALRMGLSCRFRHGFCRKGDKGCSMVLTMCSGHSLAAQQRLGGHTAEREGGITSDNWRAVGTVAAEIVAAIKTAQRTRAEGGRGCAVTAPGGDR